MRSIFTKFVPYYKLKIQYLEIIRYNYDFLNVELHYLKHYFICTFLLFLLGLPYIAMFFSLMHAALWLGYEEDPDEEEVFDRDLEGEEDLYFDEYTYVVFQDILIGLQDAPEERDIFNAHTILFYNSNNIHDDIDYYSSFYIKLFAGKNNGVSLNVSFLYSLAEWDDILTDNFGETFMNCISGELENSILFKNQLMSRLKNDSLVTNSDSVINRELLSEYNMEAHQTSDPEKNYDSFFFILYYKFFVLRKTQDYKFVYDLIIGDLNDFFYKQSYINSKVLFFSKLKLFKQKMANQNFFFYFDIDKNKFVANYDSIYSKMNPVLDKIKYHKTINSLPKWTKKKIAPLWKLYKKSEKKDFWKFRKLFKVLPKHPNQLESDIDSNLHINYIYNKLLLKKKQDKMLRLQKYIAKLDKRRKKSKILRKKLTKKQIIFENAFKARLTLGKARTTFLQYKRSQDPAYDLRAKFEKGQLWHSMYNFIERLAITQDLETQNRTLKKKSNTLKQFSGLHIMNDSLISVINRKIVNQKVESIFIQNILNYKPLLYDLAISEKTDLNFFNVENNRSFKKAIERNLDAFIKVTYKDFVLSGACSYEQLWYSLGYYSPLIKIVLSKKILFLLKKK